MGKTDKYKKKRDFKKTPEPDGGRGGRKAGKETFVFQKHDASRLHFDFRIELNGVLKSWAVPKGPSLNPKTKRLAIETEDHPLEYAYFEGIIPEDEYGGGTVMVWDRGKYTNLKRDEEDERKKIPMKRAYNDGNILISLKGKKIKGGYSLIRTGKKSEGRWLLIKTDDKYADHRRKPAKTENKSVKSGKTMKEIEKEGKG